MTPRCKPNSCAGCRLHDHGTDFSAIEGTGSSGIMVVAEASGEHEQREQLPLRPHAPAGGVFERVLRRMGLDRQQLSITNVVRCRPRNNWLEGAPWEYSAINSCRPNLEAAIVERRPRIIVALGGTALRELTGMVGEAQGISHLAGYVLPATIRPPQVQQDVVRPEMLTNNYIPVIGNFHPAFLRRGKASHQGVFARILQRAVNIAKGADRNWLWEINPEEEKTHGSVRYSVHPSLDEARSFVRGVESNGGLTLSYDIETFESASLDEDAREGFTDTQIRLIQFSVAGGMGIAFPWEGEYRELAGHVLRLPNTKCGHNVWLFDNKVLRAAGEREGLDLTPRGVIHDTLQMFHHWQPDLPAHLQFAASFVQFPFPWKHLAASDIEFYGCCDVDATLRLYQMLERTLKRDELWGGGSLGYVGQVQEVRPVLEAMELRGMPIDDAARIKLGEEFERAQTELGAELTRLAPASCGRVQPKEGYKGTPPEIRLWEKVDSVVGLSDIKEKRFKEPGDDGESYHYEHRHFVIHKVVETPKGLITDVELVNRWCRVYDFNPNSRPQVIEYMKAKHHKVPKSKEEDDDGNQKDTTAAKELMRLAARTGDDFYLKVIEYRGYTKMRGTYVDGFAPHADGCVHTTFTFDTGIGQLSSRNPNIQNFPKLKPTVALAKAMRKMVAARPGNILTEWDFKSCHVITLGFLAEDLNYMRLGRLDIHSFVAGHFLGLWDGAKIFSESDEQLLARFKELKRNPEWKRVRDDQAKHGILGIGNGLKAKGLYERYMESFPPTPCDTCGGSGAIAGVRGQKKCVVCKGAGRVPGARIAEKVLEVCEALFPNVFAYQKREVRTAHEQQFLKSPFGHIRRFYEVFRWDTRRSDWAPGDQHEEAVAYRLANIAFGHIREKLKELHAAGLTTRYGLFNNVHDSFMFEFPERMLDEHIAEVYPILVSPSKVLRHPTICPDGLVIGVEGSWGRNWSAMEEIKMVAREAGA